MRPNRGELKCREFDDYQAVYCGLCRALGQRYGILARSLLQYDFVFLAMLFAGPDDPGESEIHRCPICPLRKKRMCTGWTGLDRAADQMVILAWWKLRDTVEDEGFFRGLPARVLSRLLRRDYRRAAERRPGFDRTAREGLERLRQLETERSPSIDRTADAFASILRAAAEEEDDPARRRELEQLLYHVGRWIYLLDAVEDLEEDAARGRYNPVALRLPEKEERESALRVTLRHSLNLSRGAFELLPETRWSAIVANILYLGLPLVEQAVFNGQWKEIKKLIGRRNIT